MQRVSHLGYAAKQRFQLYVRDAAYVLFAQLVKVYHVVQTIQELWCKLLLQSFLHYATCLLLALTVMVSAFAACGGSGGETEPEETGEPPVENNYEKDKAEYDAMTAQQLVEKYVADPANITIPEYADLLATYAFVEVEDGSFVYRNKTQEALDLITFPLTKKRLQQMLSGSKDAKLFCFKRSDGFEVVEEGQFSLGKA